MSLPVTLLYEDHRGPRQGFGLHALIVACVFDVVDGERRHVEERLRDARPLKGVTNVLRACCEDIDLLAADGRFVVAVIDDDAIRHHLKLPEKTPEEAVLAAITARSRRPAVLRVALLRRNTETVLEAAAACDRMIEAARLDRAIRHKDLLERDAIFLSLSRERARPARDCVLARVPSLKLLVETVIDCLRGGTPAATSAGVAARKGKHATGSGPPRGRRKT